jgi:hypothetical protein
VPLRNYVLQYIARTGWLAVQLSVPLLCVYRVTSS